jgi:hypothetical protein
MGLEKEGNWPDFASKKAKIEAKCPEIRRFPQASALIPLDLKSGSRAVLSGILLFQIL